MRDNGPFAVDAVLLDLDGTLMDTIPLFFRALDTGFAECGLPRAPREAVLEAAKGGIFDWSRVLPPGTGPDRDRMIGEITGAIARIQPHLLRHEAKLIPGADGVLKDLARRGLKLGLVTGGSVRYFEHKMGHLRARGLDRCLGAVVTNADVSRRKPAPDPIMECARRLGVPATGTLYVGDSRVDIRSGKAAGSRTVGVLTGLDDYDTLLAEDPDAILESIAGLPALVSPN